MEPTSGSGRDWAASSAVAPTAALNDDVMNAVHSWLGPIDLGRCRLVCRAWWRLGAEYVLGDWLEAAPSAAAAAASWPASVPRPVVGADGGFPWPMEAAVRRGLAASRRHGAQVQPAQLRALQELGAQSLTAGRPLSCGWLLEGVAVLVGADGWADRTLLRRLLEMCASPQAAIGLAAVPADMVQHIRWPVARGRCCQLLPLFNAPILVVSCRCQLAEDVCQRPHLLPIGRHLLPVPKATVFPQSESTASHSRWSALEGGRHALTAALQHKTADELSFASLSRSCGSIAHLRPWLEEMLSVRSLLSGPAGPAGAAAMFRRHALLAALCPTGRAALVSDRSPVSAAADAALATALNSRPALATALRFGRRRADRAAAARIAAAEP